MCKAEELPVAQLLCKNKEIARAKKLDTDVAKGKSGVALRAAHECQGCGRISSRLPQEVGRTSMP